MPVTELHTDRLLLRGWRAEDREPFAEMNADPEVMRHFPATMTHAESDAFADRIESHFTERGFGLWAVQLLDTGAFAGFTGLSVPRFHVAWMDDRPQHPVVEVGWRLRRQTWGHGYATEAARAAVAYGFADLRLSEIVSFTVLDNPRSLAVMQKLGMRRLAEYAHPVAGGKPLPSVVYHLPAPEPVRRETCR